ncbi:cellulose synthase subunit BcsC-related outer membrane protein [Pseudoalteromonas spongiae]|uniref:cellulose synthase subunit BcsC-related outer membrane protein n=1 Tax=Pseudoalteromonas spongiae TaxID=298657 RepID=UPI00026CCDC1|nr:cellulose synthase subunit BcsC-related outer membrane protein [Pseudoalteromonas spongiae]ATC98252.1 hypothetical protein PSPO_a1129 [Pseudoalteromonas spongiae UST010723-006]
MQLRAAALLVSCLLGSQLHASEGLDAQPISWLLEQVELGEAQQKPQLVIDSLARLEQVEPGSLDIRAAWIRYYFEQGETEKAVEELKAFKKDEPFYPYIQRLDSIAYIHSPEGKEKLQAVRLLARAGQSKEAAKQFKALFRGEIPTARLKFEYANILSADPDSWQQAKKLFTKLTQRYPNTAQFEVAYARHILKRKPTDKKSLAILRKYATHSQMRIEVERVWLNALEDMPISTFTRSQYSYFFSLYPQSDLGKLQYEVFSEKLVAQLKLEADPNYQAWQRAKRHMAKENYALAEKLLRKAAAGRPKDADIVGDLGRSLMAQGKHANAQQYFSKAAKLADSSDKSIWLGLLNTAKFWGLISEARSAIDALELTRAEQLLASALKLKEDTNTVLIYSSQVAQAKGDTAQATKYLQTVLRSDPNNGYALSLLLNIVEQQQSINALERFESSLTKKQRETVSAEINAAKTAIYREQAEELSARGEPKEAIALLEKAIKTSPTNGWLYYDLAFEWRKLGDIDTSKKVYNQALWRFPMNPEIRYTHALYMRSLGDFRAGLQSLSYIRVKDYTPQIKELKETLALGEQFEQVDVLIETEQKASALALLQDIENQNDLSNLQTAQIAAQWYKLGMHNRATSQLKSALNSAPKLDFYWYQLYSEWLLSADDADDLDSWFANLHMAPAQTQSEKREIENLKVRYQVKKQPDREEIILTSYLSNNPSSIPANARLLEFALNKGDFEQVDFLYENAHKYGELEFETEYQVAEKALFSNKYALGEKVVRHLVYRVPADENYNQRRLMALLLDFKDQDNALRYQKDLLALSPSDGELLNLAGQVADKFGQSELAIEYYRQVLTKQRVDVADKKVLHDLAQDQETDTWYMRSARSGIAKIKNRTDGHIALAGDFSGQTSTQNDHELGLGAALFEGYFPFLEGQLFVKADAVSISAQQTNFSERFAASRYGTGALCYDTCSLFSITPRDQGIAFGVGWQNENWRVDIGTTPQGFLISNIVGGVLYQNSLGDFSYDIEIERRALTNSVLSYAGLEDVNQNEIWGGVTSNGITLGLYHDLGLDWGFWATLDYQYYQGKNVLDNDRKRAMTGAYYRFIQQPDFELSVGTNLLYWGYKHNLSEETYGHGGYYSPQKYLGLSVPVTVDGRFEQDLVYRLKVNGGYSRTTTDAIELYPNNPELQAVAELKAVETGIDPIFAADKSSGFSWGIEGLVEYRVQPQWLIGASFNIDRADFYEPNYGQIYVKYLFNPVYGELPLVPRLIVPYANY